MRLPRSADRRRLCVLAAGLFWGFGAECRHTSEVRGENRCSADVMIRIVEGRPVTSAVPSRGERIRGTEGDSAWRPDVAESEWLYIVLHHSATESGSVAAIHAEHRSRRDGAGNPWLGIGYHFVIGNGNGMADGEVAATFRWNEQIHGAHSGHAVFNARGIGVCLIGNFDRSRPTEQQLYAVKRLTRVLAKRHRISSDRVLGHSDVRATSCPGRQFPLDEIRRAISQTVQG